MPTITDTLRTVLQIDGLSNYLSGLRQAQQGNLQAALQVQQLHQNLQGLPRLLDQLGQALGVQTGQWALLATGMYLARNAINQIRQTVQTAMGDFEKYNTVLFRTSFLFNAMGSPVGVSGLQGFARERGARTGIAGEDTLSLLGRARQTGFGPQTAGRLVPLLQDVQTSGLTSAQNALDIINRLIHQEGRGRGSLGAVNEAATQLRLDPRTFTGGQQHDLAEIMRQLTARVGGLSDQMGQTISGTFARHQELLGQSMQRLGGVIEGSLVPILTILNRELLGINRTQDRLTDPNLPGWQDKSLKLLEALANAQTPGLPNWLGGINALRDEGQRMGARERNADHDSRKLDEIAANTLNLPSALALAIFGSASAFTRQAQSFRNFQSAVNARF